MDAKDPLMIDLVKWLRDNLPKDVSDEIIFKNVRRVQKPYGTIMSLALKEFYNHALNQHRENKPRYEGAIANEDKNQRHPSPEPNVDSEEEENESNGNQERETTSNCSTSPPKGKPQEEPTTMLEDIINSKLDEIKEYLALNDEKRLKTEKLDASTAKLDLKKEHYNLITSIRLDSCRDLMSRYNRLMSKK